MASLADLQRAPGTTPAAAAARLPLAVERVRTFDTPEFAGMTFLEVESKSALNRVSGMPFAWSLNPYRGCSHACSYCSRGDTLVLMANGATKPIDEVRKGDRLIGTRGHGRDRHYVTTTVLDQWSTVKPVWRIGLDSGQELYTSGDHRLLGQRGWVAVATALHSDVLGPGDAVPALGELVKADGFARIDEVDSLGVDLPLYDITTGTGDFIANGVISHNCFARPTHAYLNLSPLGDFEKTVVVKTNVVEVLKRELVRKSWKGEHVAMGTNTDPYQRCEGRYRLMPGIIDTFAEGRTPFSILTKGTLITRDIERLQAAADLVPVTAALTIGMLDERLWRESEPGTPSPQARLAAVRTLNDAGIPTGIMLAPIMPGLNDDHEQLAELVDAAAAAGATHISPIVLHLRPGVREVFWPWLQQRHPELVARYADLYRRSDAAKGYREAITAFVAEQRKLAYRKHGAPPSTPPFGGRRQSPAPDPSDPGAQLSLL